MVDYSADLTGGSSPNGHRLELTANVVEGGQDIAANTSRIAWTLRLRHTSGTPGSWNSQAFPWSVNIGGQSSGGSAAYDFRLNLFGTITLGSGESTVAHNPDGTLSITVSGTFTTNHIGSATASGPLDLPRIPRGPRTKVGAVWRHTIAYTNVGGEWRIAIPYTNVGGAWRAGGA
ncbi:DUF859 family phage minor structural protein [Microbacterium sp.]|uniref:DUF859 family phage minor structural protein n=1 Tax=Microbacterium sp. TaxID=51671 RepID=UPI0039195A48